MKINYEYCELQTSGSVDGFKNNGNLAKQVITVPTIAAATGFVANQSYTYDSLDRLKSAAETISGQTWKQTFNYDRFGNKTFDVANTTIISSESVVPKIANPEILPNSNKYKQDQDNDSQPDYLYDASGNITKNARQQDFTYDAENRQITAVGANLNTAYFYDGNGKRVKSYNHVNDQTTIFVYDADGDLAAEYSVNVPAPTAPTISYLTEDALGSVRVTTNSDGDVKARRDFLPFGEELYAGLAGRNINQKYSSNTDDTRKKFATYQRDAETRLDFAQSRYYSPMQGRFTSPDEFKGGPDELFDFEENASDNPTFYADLENPQSLNKYQYSYNNPYKYNDPSGHCPPNAGILECVFIKAAPIVVPAITPVVAPIIVPAGIVLGAAYIVDSLPLGRSNGKVREMQTNRLGPARTGTRQPSATSISSTAGIGATVSGRHAPVTMAQKGSTKNIQKTNPKRAETARKNIEKLKGDLQKIPKKDKTPEIKKLIERIQNQIKREIERLKKSEEHTRREKGD